jgi:putative transposase
MRSIEGKSNDAVIRYRESPVPAVYYSGLVLPLRLDRKDQHHWQAYALGHAPKYCRIVHREIRGKDRWFVQLVQRGTTLQRHDVADGVVGLDLGPSEIAWVANANADLVRFCDTIEQPWAETRVLQRAMDRSRRATNPDRFDDRAAGSSGRRKSRSSGSTARHATKS